MYLSYLNIFQGYLHSFVMYIYFLHFLFILLPFEIFLCLLNTEKYNDEIVNPFTNSTNKVSWVAFKLIMKVV